MTFNWDVDWSLIIAVSALIISQYAMHKKNIHTLAIMKYRLGMLWKAYLRDHNLPNGDDDA